MLTTEQFIELTKALGPTILAAGSALWIVFTYMRQQRETRQQHLEQAERENKTRVFEARKPFIDKQLELYTEVAKVTAKLVTTTDFESAEWNENVRRFEQLFWTELSMTEDDGVKNEMENLSGQLKVIIASDATHGVAADELEELKLRSYRLATALHASIKSSWTV